MSKKPKRQISGTYVALPLAGPEPKPLTWRNTIGMWLGLLVAALFLSLPVIMIVLLLLALRGL